MPAAKKQKHNSDEMRSEYDFSGGIRGKYAAAFARGTNVVVLAPDVADAGSHAGRRSLTTGSAFDAQRVPLLAAD